MELEAATVPLGLALLPPPALLLLDRHGSADAADELGLRAGEVMVMLRRKGGNKVLGVFDRLLGIIDSDDKERGELDHLHVNFMSVGEGTGEGERSTSSPVRVQPVVRGAITAEVMADCFLRVQQPSCFGHGGACGWRL